MERPEGCERSRSAPRRGPAASGVGRRVALLAATIGAAGLALAGCGTDSPSMLDPRGPGASHIANLWWFLFVVGGAVTLVVLALLAVALVRGRRRTADEPPPDATNFVVVGGIVIPATILVAAFAMTIWTDLQLRASGPEALRIEVVGHQFWWEVHYPEQEIRTANEIHIPVGQPVEILVNPADVIHSFWVPQLHGKIDMIPGKTNTLRLQADEPGEYRGICAEFCGLAHAHMHFLVIAEPADEFPAWVENQQLAAAEPNSEILVRGQQLFLGSACVYCHAVRGTTASSDFGPDLTHLASRRTLAAGIIENNRGNLAAWIVDPQTIKPGNAMPGIDMDSEDLQALVTYLESLE
jgi:cytochrome c oxidase subunit II